MEENQTETEKKPAAKPAAKAAAKPAAKEKQALVDNGNGTITDPNTGLTWKQTDAWIDKHRFYTWFDHREYVDEVNKQKFGGFNNWRIPSKAEATGIHDKDKECRDKNGSVYYLDPVFAEGGVGNTWISECKDDNIVRFDWKTGVETAYPSKDVWASIRLVRKEGEAPVAPAGEAKPADGAKGEAAPAKGEAKPKADAPKAAKPAGGGKPGPTKKKLTDEDKAAIRARAKAFAAQKGKKK